MSIFRSTAALAAAVLASRGFAATFTFTGSGTWSSPSNWQNGLVMANDPTTHVAFAPTSTTPVNVTVDTSQPAWILNSLVFNHLYPYFGTPDTLTINGGTTLSFTGASPTIDTTGDEAVRIVGAISSDATLIINAQSNLEILGNISAPSLSVTGGVELSGTNTLSAGITANGGSILAASVQADSIASLGSGPVTIASSFAGGFFSLQVPLIGAGTTLNISTPLIINALSPGTFTTHVALVNTRTSGTYAFSSLTINAPATIEFDAASTCTLAFNAVTLQVGANFSGPSGPIRLSQVSGNGGIGVHDAATTLILDTANTFHAGINLSAGSIYANAAGALGSGPVTLSGGSLVLNATGAMNTTEFSMTGGTLTLNATGAASSDVISNTLSTILYNANGAAGGHLIDATTIRLDSSVTSIGSDTLFIPSGGVLAGYQPALSTLTRGGNLVIASGAIVEALDGLTPAIENLGTDADLYLAGDGITPLQAVVGAGTIWAGVASVNNAAFIGTIRPTGDFSINGGTLGTGGRSFNVLSTAGSKVVMTILRPTTFINPSSNLSGLASINVPSTLTLSASAALGGVDGSAPTSLFIPSGGTLILKNSTALNGTVEFFGGSTLTLSTSTISGTGTILRDAGNITINLNTPAPFAGTQITPSFVRAGDVVNLLVNDVAQLPLVNPAATFIVTAATSFSQAGGITLDGGTLRIPLQTFTDTGGNSGINIGVNGGTLQSIGTYSAPLTIQNVAAATISVPILATGTVSFGSTDMGGFFTHGGIVLTGANSMPALVANDTSVGAATPASLGSAPITLNNSQLLLYPALSAAVAGTVRYGNVINANGITGLTDNDKYVGNGPTTAVAGKMSVGTINLNGSLRNYFINSFVTADNLHLVGDSTLSSVGGGILTLTELTDDGTPRKLSIQSDAPNLGNTLISLSGATATGPIDLTDATLFVNGPITPSASPLTLHDRAKLDGSATLPRPIIVATTPRNLPAISISLKDTPSVTILGGQLNLLTPQDSASTTIFDVENTDTSVGYLYFILPYDLSHLGGQTLTGDGTVVITQSATLTLPIDTTFSGTLIVNGRLVLAPALNPLNIDASPSFTVLNAAAPEPATLASLLVIAPLCLARRRRGT